MACNCRWLNSAILKRHSRLGMRTSVAHAMYGSGRLLAPEWRRSAFAPCPLFLLAVLVPVVIAQFDAPRLGVITPLQVFPLHRLPIDIAIFVIPFAWAARPTTFRAAVDVLAAALLLPLSNSVMPYAAHQSVVLLPHIFDPQVFALDAIFGVQPAFLVSEAFARAPLLPGVCGPIYQAIIFPIALVAAIEAQRGRRMGLSRDS